MQILISIEEALALIGKEASEANTETIALENAHQRIIAEDVCSDRDYPPFNRSAMDGIAIKSDDFTRLNITSYEIIEDILAGGSPQKSLLSGQCYKIMTGASVPNSSDAVLKIEDCKIENNIARINSSINVKPYLNIAQQGEDALKNTLIIPKHTSISPTVMAGLASVGKNKIEVIKKPSVAIIATGDEVVNLTSPVKPNQIRNSNTYSLIGQLSSLGISAQQLSLVGDKPIELEEKIKEALQYDVLIITGGVSMGAADYVPQILHQVEVRPIFHKVKIKPGKPIWFGKKNKTAVFALPGNPMSVQTTFRLFVVPYLNYFNSDTLTGKVFHLPLAINKPKKVALDEFFACNLTHEPQTSVVPLKNNGSGDIISNISSQGFARHPINASDLNQGDIIEYYEW